MKENMKTITFTLTLTITIGGSRHPQLPEDAIGLSLSLSLLENCDWFEKVKVKTFIKKEEDNVSD